MGGEEQACAGTWVFHVRTRARRSLKRSARERVEEVSCAVLRGATVSLSAIFIVINSHSLVYATPYTISALDQVRNNRYSHRAI